MIEKKAALEALYKANVPSPEADYRWLREAFDDENEFSLALKRRCAREPLQLIIGETTFRYLNIICRPDVFIPRPETEWLVELGLKLVPEPSIVLEPCVGSGAISASIAYEKKGVKRILASDINPKAVELAKENTVSYPNVEIMFGSLFDPFDESLKGKVDLVISNPPYLDMETVDKAETEVKYYDPIEALVGPGVDGWDIVRDIIKEGPEWLKSDGWLVLEDDPKRVQRSAELAKGLFREVSVKADLAGYERFLCAKK